MSIAVGGGRREKICGAGGGCTEQTMDGEIGISQTALYKLQSVM